MDWNVVNNLVKEFATENQVNSSEVEVYSFPQVWANTALGFDNSVAYDVITRAHTIVLYIFDHAWVTFDGRFAYALQNPNLTFFDDLDEMKMKPASEAHLYQTT